MERFLSSVLNIVKTGTGTRCPLDVTCVHDTEALEPSCDLSGKELDQDEVKLSATEVFNRIVAHNEKLAKKQCFSEHRIRLVYRSKKVQNMRFVDTPGIIEVNGEGRDAREDIRIF
jgi:hypothetical protein